jgi:hypothetical protein
MPPALDRLLARPSALRLPGSLVAAHAPPTARLHAAECIACTCPRRSYASAPPGPEDGRWRRWKDKEQVRRHAEENLRAFGERRQAPDRISSIKDAVHRLQEAQRRQGRDGVLKEWILRTRLGFDLPTDDTPEAELLWGTFVKDPRVVDELLDHAAHLRRRTGRVYPRLYELCIARWLPHQRRFGQALVYHQFMRRELQLEQLPLQHLARINKGRLTTDMYDTLLEMYKDSSEKNLYDDVVPELARFPAWALAWHAACILKGDLPSPEVAASPMVQEFIACNATSSNPEVRVNAAVAGSLGIDEQMDQALLRRLHGPDTAPVRFEDSFCARMFATRAVPPDSVIRGLALVGVNEIGPLAVRSMASRTDPISELPQRFDELRASGIALQGCVFSLALESFAQNEQHLLVRSLLESDQHPEVYDDPDLQTKLLDHYLEEQDWNQAHRTLAILSLFHQEPATRAWNLLLQSHIQRCAPSGIVDTLQSMSLHKIIVNQTSIIKLKSDVLRPRRRGHFPMNRAREKFDDLRFVARVYLFIMERNMGHVPPYNWREILRRFGITGRMRELRRLIHWLVPLYAPPGKDLLGTVREPGLLEPGTEISLLQKPGEVTEWNPSASGGRQAEGQKHKSHPLQLLFPDPFKQGLVVWGFRAGLLPFAPIEQSLLNGRASKKRLRRQLRERGIIQNLNWDIGLRTLTELRDLGIYVNSRVVVKALQMMFVNLFGRGHSRITHNRLMEAANTTPYAVFVRRVNEIWGKPLFPEPNLYNRSSLHSLMWHPRFNRVVPRRGHLKLTEISEIASRRNAGVREDGSNTNYIPTHVRRPRDDELENDLPRSSEQRNAGARNADISHETAFQQLLATCEAHQRARKP